MLTNGGEARVLGENSPLALALPKALGRAIVSESETRSDCICVRRAQEARLQSLAMQLAESDCTLRVTNTHLCSADSARAKEK